MSATVTVAVDFFGSVLAVTPGSSLNYVAGAGTQTLTGTSANEVFVAGSGVDTLIGGGGSDQFTYVGANTTIVQLAGGVNTAYQSGDTFTLPANIQNLTVWSGSASYGNAMGNIIRGPSYGGELMDGEGGNDVLIGSGGDNIYQFDAVSGYDVIANFNAGSASTADTVRLSGYGQFQTFSEVQAAMTQVGSDVVLRLDANDAIKFDNTTISAFTVNNFQYALNTSGFTLTFDDEFNSLSLDSIGTTQSAGTWLPYYTSWNGLPLHTETGTDQQIYVDPTYAGTGTKALGINPFSINNGVLTITAAPTPTADLSVLSGHTFTSGILTTQQSFSQTYGYFEARMELPSGTGAFPAFWLLPEGNKPPAEIDVIEAHGANTISTTVHTGATGTATANYAYEYIPQATSGFHTYGVLWTATGINFYVDDVEVFSTPTPSDMTSPMYMLLDLAVTADAPANMTTSMEVDYVRAYSISGVTQTSTSTGSTSTASTPAVAALSVTSLTAQPVIALTSSHSAVGVGQVIAVKMTLGEVATVVGTPVLRLSNGETATYASGSGTSTLVFNYTVKSGDDTTDLKVTGLTLPTGASVTGADGATPSVSTTSDLALVVDTVAPSVSSVSANAAAGSSLKVGQSVTITVTTSEAVNVSGTPTLQLSDGEKAVYAGGSGTNKLTFTYQAAGGYSSTDLKVSGLILGTGTAITDLAGNALTGSTTSDLGLVLASSIVAATYSATAVTVTSQLNLLAKDVNLISVTLSDHATLTVTAAQASADAHVLSLIQGAHVLHVTSVTGQDYTDILEQFNASGVMTFATYSGITDQAYTSYTKSYTAGVLTAETFSGFKGATSSVVDVINAAGAITSESVYDVDGERHNTVYAADGTSTVVNYTSSGLRASQDGFDANGRETYANTYNAAGVLVEKQAFNANGTTLTTLYVNGVATSSTLSATAGHSVITGAPTLVDPDAGAGETISAPGVLSGLTDSAGYAMTVTGVANAANIAGNVGTALTGTYGTLTMNADGSYDYVADQGAAIVAAPNGAPIEDVFSFTVSDGHGGVLTSTLTLLVSLGTAGKETVTSPMGAATLSLGGTSLTVNLASAGAFGGVIQDGSSGSTGGTLIVQGTAPLTLTNTETYTGHTQVYGVLDLAGAGSVSASSNVALKSTTAVFDISGATAAESIGNLNGVGGTIDLGANSLTVRQTTAASFAGVIADGGAAGGVGGSLIVQGAAPLTLTNAQTYTGHTQVYGVLDLAGAGSVSASSNVALKSTTAVFDISGATAAESIGNLNGGGGTIDLGANSLTVHQTTAASFAGVIANGGAAGGAGGSLIVQGTAPLTLTNAETYTGHTQVYGVLDLTGAGSVSASSNVALKAAGAVFDISGATSTENIGSLNGVSGSTVNVGSVTLNVHQATSASYAGVIQDGAHGVGGGLVIDGPGTLTLSGNNTFTGGVTLHSGALELAAMGAAGSHAIAFSSSATLLIDNAALTGSGAAMSFGNLINEFATGDMIDLTGLAYTSGATATYSSVNGDLVIASGASAVTLHLGEIGGTEIFSLTADSHGGIDIVSHATADITHGMFG